MTTKKDGSLTISGKGIKGVDGYDIFFAKCNHGKTKSKFKKVKTIKKGKKLTWTKKGMKKGVSFKAYAKAFVKEDGKKVYVKRSPYVHAFVRGYNKKSTNAKSLKVKKTSFTLKPGKTAKIKAKVIKLKKKKKLISKKHTPKLRYYSSNNKVATVSKKGKITAKSKGTCDIRVITHNGISKKIKVTVK